MSRRSLALAPLALAASCLFGADGVGYPSRSPSLDALPGFRTPPPGYGEVAFYWWLGDPLTKDRLTWQLDQLKGKGISALQVNYAHSDKGGRSYGLTYPSQPALFSGDWWDLFGWFLKESKQRGMAASLSDYTLGWAGNGWYIDEILKDHSDIHGAALTSESYDCSGLCVWQLSADPLSIQAYRTEAGRIVAGTAMDLRESVQGRALRWTAPAGTWRLVSVSVKDAPISLDPMHPLSGSQMIEKFFQRFEDRNRGQSGSGLNFFFSDELSFGVRGWLWNSSFVAEFERRKGYDVRPELASLFAETGPRAVKVRLDYSDVMVSLEEEHYFRPLYEWHQKRGMLYGCDHGGRGRDVTEFGDYFRTQRWMSGPGNDQPGLASDVIKNKVASSITHLYERQRTWLEGYYSSGWGTTSAQIVDATWRNFAQGQNLLTLHGLYYSTHGGWWEWAPPCNHFHMPYWNHMGDFLHTVERMSYLLSQGVHRADVAIVYPVAAMEAGLGGKQSVDAAFSLGRDLYGRSIDFDYMDFESLARAKVEDRMLKVAGEEYRVLVLPAMRAVRHSTLEKAVEFHRAGGTVIVLGAAPEATDRVGADDPQVAAMVRELAGTSAADNAAAVARMDNAMQRDVQCKAATQPSVFHRKIGARDVYMVYGAARDSECTFRSTGSVELWDPWTGNTRSLPATPSAPGSLTIRMPLEKTEAQLIVFSPGRPRLAVVHYATRLPREISGDWEFELKPTLDNRFGDYRLPASPAFIGAEARRFRYSEQAAAASDPRLDDSAWPQTTYTYGPHLWKLGPLPNGVDTTELERRLAALDAVDPAVPVEFAGRQYRWTPYEFSMRWGVENDAGHQGYHGLKAEMPEEFIALGRLQLKPTTSVYTEEEGGSRYYLWTSAMAPRAMQARILSGGLRPAALWVNHAAVYAGASAVAMAKGANPMLLRYDKPGRGSFFLEDPATPDGWKQTYPLSSVWYNRPGLLVYDTRPAVAKPAGWYRTTAPPGMRSLTMIVRGKPAVWIDGRSVQLGQPRPRGDGSFEYRVAAGKPSPAPVKVAIRVQQERGVYGGAAFPEPVAFDCAPGLLAAGDWSRIDGLSSYSGGAWYRKTVELTPGTETELDLGMASASAEVWVNGQPAGTRLAPPYRYDISKLVKTGKNRVEVLVYSALSNHYQTIPTRYLSPSPSGLLGPVRILQGP